MNGRTTRKLRRQPFRNHWYQIALLATLLGTVNASEQTTPTTIPSGPTVDGVRDAVNTLYRDTGVPASLTKSLKAKEDAVVATQTKPTAPVVAATTPAVAVAVAPAQAQAGTLDLVVPKSDESVGRTGCTTCGGYHSQSDSLAFHSAIGGCSDGQCVPGREKCDALPTCNTFAGAFVGNLYQSLCCPDPCYQPRWDPAANASMFADYAKPRTITRFRYDLMQNMTFPDRNEYFFKQSSTSLPYKNKVYRTYPSARVQQIYMYQEAAAAAGSLFVEYPYLQINPMLTPTQAGFGDIRFGSKSVLYDVEMLRVTFQFKTYMPTGNASKILGTGHVSLEPSILTSLKLGPETYLQGQFGQWIPLGGTQGLAGGIFFWYLSLNQVLTYVTPSSPLIVMLEMDGWSFENGGYSNPLKVGPKMISSGGGVSYFNIGPGLRLSICDKIDVGGTITWATQSMHWGNPWFRFEVRFLF